MTKRRISPERILWELEAIAFARVPECMELADGQVRLKETLKPAQRAAVAAIEKSSSGIKVKFYDKMKALELLGKHLGMFDTKTPQKPEAKSNLLEMLVAGTGEDIDTDDLPEVE